MKRGKSTGKPTKAEQARLDAIKRMDCIACELEHDFFGGIYKECGAVEGHHLVDKGNRKHSGGHMATIPLGEWHHRGVVPGWLNGKVDEARKHFGPSLFHHKKEFIERYGCERNMLSIIDAKLIEKGLLKVTK